MRVLLSARNADIGPGEGAGGSSGDSGGDGGEEGEDGGGELHVGLERERMMLRVRVGVLMLK